MKNKYLVVIFMLLASLACGIQGKPEATQTPSEQGAEDRLEPDQIEDESSGEAEATPSACQGENWQIVPTGSYEHPLDDGKKLLIVELAVANHSDLWGRLKQEVSEATVSTEKGSVYEATVVSRSIPVTPSDSPYAGEYISSEVGVGSGISMKHPLPPGFAITDSITTDNHPFNLIFRVEEDQHQFTLTLDGISVACFFPDGNIKTQNIPPIVMELEPDASSVVFPTDRPNSDLSDIPEFQEIPNMGVLEFLDASRVYFDEQNDLVSIVFKYTNDQGRPVEGNIIAYIVGDDGVVIPVGCGDRHTGGCTDHENVLLGAGHIGTGPTRITVTDLNFLVPNSISGLKLIWLGVNPTAESIEYTDFDVYNLPFD